MNWKDLSKKKKTHQIVPHVSLFHFKKSQSGVGAPFAECLFVKHASLKIVHTQEDHLTEKVNKYVAKSA